MARRGLALSAAGDAAAGPARSGVRAELREVNHVSHCPEPAERRCGRQKVIGAALAAVAAVLFVDAWFVPDRVRIDRRGFAVSKQISW